MISNIESYTLSSYYCKRLCLPHTVEEETGLINKLLAELCLITGNDFDKTSTFITALLKDHYESTCDYETQSRYCKTYILGKSESFQGVSGIVDCTPLVFNYKGTKKIDIYKFNTLIFSALDNILLPQINVQFDYWLSNLFCHFLDFTDYY